MSSSSSTPSQCTDDSTSDEDNIVAPKTGSTDWYKTTEDFWIHSPPTVGGLFELTVPIPYISSPSIEGMLGKLSYVAPPDESGSLKYIAKKFGTKSKVLPKTVVLDVGGGIGRVTEKVLLKCFETVDIHDQNSTFIEEAQKKLQYFVKQGRLRNTFVVPLQSFSPPLHEYDVIWIQWVIGYLPDEDMVLCLNRMRASLKPKTGVVVLKENVAREDDIVDPDDHYIIRSLQNWCTLLNRSDLALLSYQHDSKLPKGILPVYFFFLRPRDDVRAEEEETTSAEPRPIPVVEEKDEEDPVDKKADMLDWLGMKPKGTALPAGSGSAGKPKGKGKGSGRGKRKGK